MLSPSATGTPRPHYLTVMGWPSSRQVALWSAMPARIWLGVGLFTGDFLRPQGAPPPKAFTPFGRGEVYCLAPEEPLIRGMPTGLKVFLAMQEACGLWPCNWTHLKNDLVTNLYGGGTYDKYPSDPYLLGGGEELFIWPSYMGSLKIHIFFCVWNSFPILTVVGDSQFNQLWQYQEWPVAFYSLLLCVQYI